MCIEEGEEGWGYAVVTAIRPLRCGLYKFVIWPVTIFELMAKEVCEIEVLVRVRYYSGLGPGLRKTIKRRS
jgi:hypothetical protein